MKPTSARTRESTEKSGPSVWSRFSPHQTALICLGLLLAILVAYWPVRLNDFVLYDDGDYLTNNSQVQKGLSWEGIRWAFTTGHAANWHPLTWISHMLDVELFGMNPAGHHLSAVGWHSLNTLLVFLTLLRMTGAGWRCAFVAMLFAIHPLHVESVAWASERKDLLSTFFGLGALFFYARYGQADAPDRGNVATGPPYKRGYSYAASCLCFALSLMSKPMLVTLPFVLLLLDYWPLRRWEPTKLLSNTSRRLLLEKMPFFALAASSIVVTLIVQKDAGSHFRELSFGARAANAVVSYARYLGKCFWPDPLAIPYPHPSHWPGGIVLGAATLLILASVVIIAQFKKRPWLVVGWFFFLGTMIPVIGLIQVGVAAMADRYTYVPLLGIFIMLTWSIRPIRSRQGIAAASLALLVFASVLITLTQSQVAVWRSTETLFTHAIEVTESNWVAHGNLASWFLLKYQKEERGGLDAQQLSASTPNSKNLELAILHARKALESVPNFADIRIILAKALVETGALAEAEEHLRLATQLDPKNAEGHQLLAENLYRKGFAAEAVVEFRRALELRPDWSEVLNNLAWMLATDPKKELRNGAEAVRLATRAVELTQRTNFWYLDTLSAAQASVGEFGGALNVMEEARKIAEETGNETLKKKVRERVALYRAGKAVGAE